MSLRTLRAPRSAPRAALPPPRKPCPHPHCGTLTAGGFCREHARQEEEQRPNADVRRWYRTPRWRKLRASVLRAAPFCEECIADRLRVRATEVDHIKPHRGEPALFWDRANLQGLCRHHHAEKTGRGE